MTRGWEEQTISPQTIFLAVMQVRMTGKRMFSPMSTRALPSLHNSLRSSLAQPCLYPFPGLLYSSVSFFIFIINFLIRGKTGNNSIV